MGKIIETSICEKCERLVLFDGLESVCLYCEGIHQDKKKKMMLKIYNRMPPNKKEAKEKKQNTFFNNDAG